MLQHSGEGKNTPCCFIVVGSLMCFFFLFQVGTIVDVLKDRSSHHNGFPVVDYRNTGSDQVKPFFPLFLALQKQKLEFSHVT